jgi:HSP20 family protein
MNGLMKQNHTLRKVFTDSRDKFFGRTIDDILGDNFFNSFDTNIREEENSYRLEIAVPGMKRKDITIHLADTIMWVSAQKEEKNTSWNSMEFNSRRFQRSFALPADADINNTKAKCRNGLLTIHIGKLKVKGTHRVIKVNGESSDQTPGNLTSWWNRLMDKTRQLFVKKN